MIKGFLKNKLFNAALVIFSFGLVLCAAELVFRFIYPVRFASFIDHSTKDWFDSDIFLASRVTRPSQILGYEWMPNVKNGWLTTNSLGMYDRERQKIKPRDTYRIICLGDSTTANEDWVRFLEESLNRNSKDRKFEVWNCGVTGYNLLQYCRAIQEKWLACDPDMVIIGFCLNDFDTTPLVVREGDVMVGYFPSREILPIANPFLFKHSALYRFIMMRIFFSTPRGDPENIINASRNYRNYLQQTENLLSAKKVNFLIVILGLTKEFSQCPQQWQNSYKQIKELVREYNIDSLDMVPVFQSNNPISLMREDELHFNEKGSQLVAQEIYAYLLMKNFPVRKKP
jgi:lysophospholipase L1-like esterase